MTDLAGRTAELLSTLIRNGCVNDDTDGSGNERRSADVLSSVLPAGSFEVHHPADLPARASVVARLDGTDPEAPTLLLLAHTDVVPVNPAGWARDPFAGEIVDGEVWGRGAVDMLNQAAGMALAFAELAAGPRLRGSLVFAATADEETGGYHGVLHLLEHHPDVLRCDVALTEAGGTVTRTARGPVLDVGVGEKGMAPMTARRPWPRRPRLDAARRRQRPRDRRRGDPAHRRGPAGHDGRRGLAALGRRHGRRRGAAIAAARRAHAVGRPPPPARRRGRARPRLHPQHVHPDARRRRAEEQHRARRGDGRARRAHRARRDRGRRRALRARPARRPAGRGRGALPHRAQPLPRHRPDLAVAGAGRGPGAPGRTGRADAVHRRHRRPPPARPRHPRLRLRRARARRSTRRRTGRASTATTSASTSSRWPSRRPPGPTSPATSCPDASECFVHPSVW